MRIIRICILYIMHFFSIKEKYFLNYLLQCFFSSGGIFIQDEYYEVGACTRSILCVSGTDRDLIFFAVEDAGGAAVAVAAVVAAAVAAVAVAASDISLAKALPMPQQVPPLLICQHRAPCSAPGPTISDPFF